MASQHAELNLDDMSQDTGMTRDGIPDEMFVEATRS